MPEAQMDRFLLKEVINYPEPVNELEILQRIEVGTYDRDIEKSTTITLDDVIFLQKITKKVYVDIAIKNYIVALINGTRQSEKVIYADLARYAQFGASPRGAIALMQVGRALALLHGRNHVIPEDIKYLKHSVLRHRIILNFEATADQVRSEQIIDAIFDVTPTP